MNIVGVSLLFSWTLFWRRLIAKAPAKPKVARHYRDEQDRRGPEADDPARNTFAYMKRCLQGFKSGADLRKNGKVDRDDDRPLDGPIPIANSFDSHGA